MTGELDLKADARGVALTLPIAGRFHVEKSITLVGASDRQDPLAFPLNDLRTLPLAHGCGSRYRRL